MPYTGEPQFHQRFCRASGCGALFWVCRSCWRGQAYCTSSCRSGERLVQRRRANQRHRRSADGRADHRDRQRRYRQRRSSESVTDQGSGRLPEGPKLAVADPPPASTLSCEAERPQESAYARENVGGRLFPGRLWQLRCSRCGRRGRFASVFTRWG